MNPLNLVLNKLAERYKSHRSLLRCGWVLATQQEEEIRRHGIAFSKMFARDTSNDTIASIELCAALMLSNELDEETFLDDLEKVWCALKSGPLSRAAALASLRVKRLTRLLESEVRESKQTTEEKKPKVMTLKSRLKLLIPCYFAVIADDHLKKRTKEEWQRLRETIAITKTDISESEKKLREKFTGPFPRDIAKKVNPVSRFFD